MTVKEDQSPRGVREENKGGGVQSPWQHPPSVQTSKEGGRTSNPNRQRSSGCFLKGYTQRRRRRAREGRVGAPAPRATPPPPRAPGSPPATPTPRAPGGRPGLGPRELGRVGQLGPQRQEGGVCAPGGGADQPAFLPPALPAGSLRPGADPPSRFLPPDRADGGRRGAPRSSGESAGERLPRGLDEPARTNSSWGAQGLRRRRGEGRAGRGAPRQKARAGAAAPPPLPSRSPIELTRTGDSTNPSATNSSGCSSCRRAEPGLRPVSLLPTQCMRR